MTPITPLVYEERLTAPRAWWVIAVLFGVSMALIFLPYGLIAALIALAAGTCPAGMFVSAQGSVRIRVTGDTLFAADARIPLSVLGTDEVPPYLYLATRTPERLAQALRAARV